MSNTPKLLELFYLLFLNSPKKRNRFFWGIGAAAFIILPPLIPISVIDFWKNIDSVICWGYVCGLAQVATEHPFFLSYSHVAALRIQNKPIQNSKLLPFPQVT